MNRLILPLAILCTVLAATTANAGFFNFDEVGSPQGPTASTAFGGYGCCGHVPSNCDNLWVDFCSQSSSGHHACGGCRQHGLRGGHVGCRTGGRCATGGCAHRGCAHGGCATNGCANNGCANNGCANGGCATNGYAHGGCAELPTLDASSTEQDAPPMPPAEVPHAARKRVYPWLWGVQR